MWILECSGDDLKGKKSWLRPGTKLHFGRTNINDKGQVIVLSHKTISRNHLSIEVNFPDQRDFHIPHNRSKIVVKDLNTKIGTFLNGQQIRGSSVELNEPHNKIQLGRYEHNYYITWVPVNFTFSLDTEGNETDLTTKLCSSLGPLDIKILANYEREHTTHVISVKWNTAKALQALIDGKYIVQHESFINALVSMTSEENKGLELDFDGNFPKPSEHLPLTNNTLTELKETDFHPSMIRQNIFVGHTFIFHEKSQFIEYNYPITAGGGKSHLYEMKPHETKFDEFVGYIKNFSRERESSEHCGQEDAGRLILIAFNPPMESDSQWYAEFRKQASLTLRCHFIDQDELFKAVVKNDTSAIRKYGYKNFDHVDYEPGCLRSRNIIKAQKYTPFLESEKLSTPLPQNGGRVRRNGRLKMIGFDDDFSGTSSPKAVSEPPIELAGYTREIDESQSQAITPAEDLSTTEDSISRGLAISSGSINMALKHEHENLNDRKRKNVMSPIEEKHNDGLLNVELSTPSWKRRRIYKAENVDIHESITEHPNFRIKQGNINERKTERNNSTEADTEKEVVSKDNKEERQRIGAEYGNDQERVSLEDKLDVLQSAEIRNKIKIENIKVRLIDQSDKTIRPPSYHGWDEHWNGRKNFKKFRRKGGLDNVKGFNKVIVQLVEAKDGDREVIGDLWDDEELISTNYTKKIEKNQLKKRDPHLTDFNMKRHSRSLSQTNTCETIQPQNLGVDEHKRVAVYTKGNTRQVKRRRITTFEREKDHSEDSDDSLKFRFRKNS
ncbi:DNA damage response protein RcaA [Blumeria hordei DH14]|uniref:DNA damage response protein RcaA n=1 Tax=Blumeria graminis f. sp. hordei (strain DH14) TaxID=546991 RepID=N1JG86_BLUG1|nr:DNA damage response protein RcaA [Blumeria hordei DH14]